MTRDEAITAVLDAIYVKGPNPKYHDKMMAKVAKEWPSLWKALMQLAQVAVHER